MPCGTVLSRGNGLEDEDSLYWWRSCWALFLYFDEEAGPIARDYGHRT